MDKTHNTPEGEPRQQDSTQRKEIVRSADLPSSFFRSWNAASCAVRKDRGDKSPAQNAAMNQERRITLGQLEQGQPHEPACHARDFAAGKQRVLEALEQAGAAGLMTRELTDRGGGMRPPNRIHDLREDGVAIKPVSEGRGIYRYILCKYLPEEKAKAAVWQKLRDKPVTGLELWDAVRE